MSGFRVKPAYKSSRRPELGFGIQVVAGDRKVAWHLADYLQDLEKEIMENLFQNTLVKS